MNGEASSSSPAARAVQVTALVLIALTPLFNVGEVGPSLAPALFGPPAGSAGSAFPQGTPFFIKAIKDIGLWLMLGVGLVLLGQRRSAALGRASGHVTAVYAAVLAAVLASAALSLLDAPSPAGAATQVYAGVRWALPVFVAYALMGGLDAPFAARAARVAAALLLANAAIQAVQIATGAGAITNASSVLPRASGFFAVPNTAGLFACVTAFAAHATFQRRTAIGVWLLAIASALAAASAGAMVALLAAMYFLALGGRWLRLRLIALPVFALTIGLNIDALSGRTDVLSFSAPMRLTLLTNAAARAGPVSSEFGLGTNSGRLLTEATGVDQTARILDSFPATVIFNTGWLGALAFAVAFGALLALALRAGWRADASGTPRADAVAFCAMLAAMCLSTSVTEAFPISLMLAVWLGVNVPQLVRT